MNKKLCFIISSALTLCACGESKEQITMDKQKGAETCFNSDLYDEGNQQVTAVLFHDSIKQVDISTSQGVNDDNIATLNTESYRLNDNHKLYEPYSKRTITRKIDKSNKQYIDLSMQIESNNGVHTEVALTPQYKTNFNIKEGADSAFITYTETAKNEGDKQENESQFRSKKDFLGMKEITTPLGTFATCHLRYTNMPTSTKKNESSYRTVIDYYYTKQTGLAVKIHTKSYFGPSLSDEMSSDTFLLKANLGDQQYIASSAWLKAHNLEDMVTAD